MIRKLEDVDPSNYERNFIIEFIQKVSPFTETNPRLKYLIEEFLDSDMKNTIAVATNETMIDPDTRENKIKYFMLWLNGRNLYTGTQFIKESEVINFGNYEK